MRIVLLHEKLGEQARIDERDALVQLAAIEKTLRAAGHGCARLAMDLDLGQARRQLREQRPGLVFNLVESLAGSGRLAHLAPALCEALGIPCTGAPAAVFLETTDKLAAKRRLASAGLPTPSWIESGGGHAAVRADPAGRFIVKPVCEDASVGVDDAAVVRGEAQARQLMARAPWPVFAEAFIEGREFNLSLLEKDGGDAELLPAAEIRFEKWPTGKPRIVGYAAKWEDDSFEALHTLRRFEFPATDAALLAHLGELAHACWRLFGLRGYARVDFRVHAGEPSVLEINANPCLSPDAGFAAAGERAGLALAQIVERIVAAARPAHPSLG